MPYTQSMLEKIGKEFARRHQIVMMYAITSVKFSLPSELHRQMVDTKYKSVTEALADLKDTKMTRETRKELEANLTAIMKEWEQFEKKNVREITLLLGRKATENPKLQPEIVKHLMVIELLEHELHEETSTPKAVASLILRLRAIEAEVPFAYEENGSEAKKQNPTERIHILISSLQSLLQQKSPPKETIAEAPYAAVKKFLFEYDVPKYYSDEGRKYFAMAKEVFSNKRTDADYLKLIETHGIPDQATTANHSQSFFAGKNQTQQAPLENDKKDKEQVTKRKPS